MRTSEVLLFGFVMGALIGVAVMGPYGVIMAIPGTWLSWYAHRRSRH